MYLDKRSFILAASLILSAGAAFPQAAPAETPKENKQDGRKHDGARGGQRMAEALNLTDAQKEQAKAIREKYRASSQDVRTQMRTLHDQLKAARDANNTAEVDRLSKERETLMANAKQTWTAQRNEIRSILTPEQQAKFDQLQENHKGRRGGKHDRSEQPQA